MVTSHHSKGETHTPWGLESPQGKDLWWLLHQERALLISLVMGDSGQDCAFAG
jgi:hypothetical protein